MPDGALSVAQHDLDLFGDDGGGIPGFSEEIDKAALSDRGNLEIAVKLSGDQQDFKLWMILPDRP